MLTSIALNPVTKDIPQWQPATWPDYLAYRDNEEEVTLKLFFYQNQLLIEIGQEGINHSQFADLLTMMLGFWFARHPDEKFSLFGRCQIEKPNQQAAAPDLVLYLGDNYPK